MRDKYGVGIAGGQDELKGKIFRIATMGTSLHLTLLCALPLLKQF